jgi:hypothetical protein
MCDPYPRESHMLEIALLALAVAFGFSLGVVITVMH